MTQMIVRPPQFWLNPFGSFAEEFKVFIGKPNQDPTQALSQLTVTDGKTGAIVNQPIIVSEGITRNTSGQQILPVINTQQYAIYYQSPNGETVYSEADFFGDGLESSGGGGGSIVDEQFNNLEQAKAANLDGINYIFIKSEDAGWEGTPEGPNVNEFYYYTGGTGDPQTGDKETFYDIQGNEFKVIVESTIVDLTDRVTANETNIAQNTSDIAQNTSDIAANAESIDATRTLFSNSNYTIPSAYKKGVLSFGQTNTSASTSRQIIASGANAYSFKARLAVNPSGTLPPGLIQARLTITQNAGGTGATIQSSEITWQTSGTTPQAIEINPSTETLPSGNNNQLYSVPVSTGNVDRNGQTEFSGVLSANSDAGSYTFNLECRNTTSGGTLSNIDFYIEVEKLTNFNDI